jgi:hypothetical protein
MDSSIHDLPPGAVQYIVEAARGRLIPGTNRYASVCKGWHTASPAEADDEQLHLYLDQAATEDNQAERATQWLAQHGKGVAGLELPTTTWGFVKITLGYSGIASSLQRLDIRGPNTLVGLLAAQVQLPHLQHLTACISQYDSWQVEPGVVLLEEEQEAAGGVHPLQQACPALKDLCLDMTGDWNASPQPGLSGMDSILPRLLPPTLQQLRMDCTPYDVDNAIITPHLALGHLTGLQRLELRVFRIRDPTSFLQLPPAWGVSLVECWTNGDLATPQDWQPLDERLTALSLCYIIGDVTVVSDLTRLTSLWVDTNGWQTDSALPLAGLTGLQQLNIDAGSEWDGDGARPEQRAHQALLQVASTSSLRHLGLRTFECDNPALLTAVGALTQLTFLCLGMDGRGEAEAAGGAQGPGGGQQQGQQVGDAQQGPQGAQLGVEGVPGGPLWALRGLVGLRQLQLTGTHLLWYPTTWLSHLTQLSVLVVNFYNDLQHGVAPPVLSERMAAVVPRLQGSHPASLQQVVLYVPGTPVCDVVPSPLPGVAVGVRPPADVGYFPMPRAPRPMQPCAHLPGVWELLPEQA